MAYKNKENGRKQRAIQRKTERYIKWKKDYYQKNKEEILEKQREYRKNNRDKAYSATRKWAKNNPKKTNGYKKKWIENNPEKNKKAKSKYTKNNPEVYRKIAERFREKYPEKVQAQALALRKTNLGNECENCNSKEFLSRHHQDYSKPLEVITLCRKCHYKLHKEGKLKGGINLKHGHK